MPSTNRNPRPADSGEGALDRKILTKDEYRAIFEEITNQRLPEIISRLPPSYIAKNKQRIMLAIQKAERLRGEGSLAAHSDSVWEKINQIRQKIEKI